MAVFERQQAAVAASGASTVAASTPAFKLVGRIKAHTRIVWGLHWSPDSQLLATASRDGKGGCLAAGSKQPLRALCACNCCLQALCCCPMWRHSCPVLWLGLPPPVPAVKVWSLATAADSAAAAALPLPEAPAAIIPCGDSVRVVQFAPDCQPGASYHMAAGLESGVVQLLSLAVEAGACAGGQLAVSSHQLVWQSSDFERHAAAVRRLCWRRDDAGSEEEQGAALAPPQQEQQQRYLLASCSDDHSLRVHSVQL